MAHESCQYCGKTIFGDTSVLNKLLQEHIQREHEQGYRRADSWNKCSYCGGRGKDTNGITCKNCDGSGIR